MAGPFVVVIDPAALAEELRGPTGPVTRHLIIVGEKVKREAIRIAPRRTGNLANHIVKRITSTRGETTVLVGVERVPYAIWVHEGANPHVIEARNVPNLVFWWERENRLFVGKRVNHPGNPPNRFLIRARDAVRAQGGT